MSTRIVYLMRGLPSCGKSHTAAKLAGPSGVVLETDQYFHTHVGDDPESYDFRRQLMPQAQAWNFARFVEAVAVGRSPIVVDRGNSRNAETRKYARHAVAHDYEVELAEPESPWWQEIRVLLKYKPITDPILDEWAQRLSQMSRTTHRVPVSTIRHWIKGWKHDLTVAEILGEDEPPTAPSAGEAPPPPGAG